MHFFYKTNFYPITKSQYKTQGKTDEQTEHTVTL